MAKGKRTDLDEFEEEEELEELDSEDDGEDNANDYIPPDTISEMHWHRRQIQDIVEMMQTPWLNLNPDYQRDVVWTHERMTKLINSLMSCFYVPPLIFNVTKVNPVGVDAERFMRVSIDGKQRLTSIREFVNGNIPCTDNKNRRWYFCMNPDNVPPGRKTRRILPAKARRRFLKLELLCVEYSNLERRQEEDLFSRVQLGMPLTPAEKLRASSGDWQDFAIQLEKDYQDMIARTIDNRRGRGFQLILQVLKQILNGQEDPPTYSAGATALKGFCDRPQFLNARLKKEALGVFKRYDEVVRKFPDTFDNHGYRHATKFSPIEFVGVAVLIHRFPDRNARLLSADILDLRKYVRETRQDLRSNTFTWKAIMEFIIEIESHRGGVEPLPTVNRKFGSAMDGETGISEVVPSKGDISTQDATGRISTRAASARRVITTATASTNRLAPTAAAKPPSPPPPPSQTTNHIHAPHELQIKHESFLNKHRRAAPLPPPSPFTAPGSPLFRALSREFSETPAPAPQPRPQDGPPAYNTNYAPIQQHLPSTQNISTRFRAVHSSTTKRELEEEHGGKGTTVKREKLGGR